MWGLLMFYLIKCLCFYPHVWIITFEAGDSKVGSLQVCEKMVRARVQHHTVFKRSHKSTMIHWQTWDFQHSDSDQSTILSLPLLLRVSLVLMAVRLKPWREVLDIFYWSTFILSYVAPIHLPERPDKFHLILQSTPQAPHGHPPFIHARHDKACPCENSLLTLLFRMVSGPRTDQSLFLRMIASQGHQRRTSRLFFSKAGNSNCPKSTT